MKLQIFKSLQKEVWVACSGGLDSVTLSLFLKDSGKEVNLVYYKHPFDDLAEIEAEWLEKFSKAYSFKSLTISDKVTFEMKKPNEKLWRVNRFSFFSTFNTPILTGHHLDDAVEWYVMTSLNGNGCFMPYETDLTMKPFLLQKKADLKEWLYTHYPNLAYLEDGTNLDPSYCKRNFVRNKMVPLALEYNPGLYTTIKNKLISLN
jgi:tRNA(Ile)-lysidine synthase TilS/MesJ